LINVLLWYQSTRLCKGRLQTFCPDARKGARIHMLMPKRPFKRQQKKKRHGANFWDHEYTNPENLALSNEPGEDFLKFTRYLSRHHPDHLTADNVALDLGCGNGRHLQYLAHNYDMKTIGFDISRAAIKQAKLVLPPEHHQLEVRSIAEPLPIADNTCSLIFDMMTSHFLSAVDRARVKEEIVRVATPGALLLCKTFLRDGDLHTKRLLTEHPGPEENTYIHPTIGVPEYVYSEAELRAYLEPEFTILRVYRSHKHRFRGRARKRRTITIYAQLL